MKKLLLQCIFLVVISNIAHAQCNIDAGNDVYLCVDKFGNIQNDVQLQPRVLSAYPIAKTHWSFNHIVAGFSTINGSDTLIFSDQDSTITKIKKFVVPLNNYRLSIYVDVTDSLGNNCKDSLHALLSHFSTIPDFTDRTIAPNVHVKIYSLTGLGIQPLKYEWSPNYNIDDITIEQPTVYPSKSTTYICKVTDSLGCKSDWYDQWNIYVDSTLSIIEETNNINAQIFPNPITSHSILKFDNSTGEEYVIDVFDIQGKNTYHSIQIANTILLGDISFTKGCSIITILKKKQLLYKAKLIVE